MTFIHVVVNKEKNEKEIEAVFYIGDSPENQKETGRIKGKEWQIIAFLALLKMGCMHSDGECFISYEGPGGFETS